jgi:CBS domain-containing protein
MSNPETSRPFEAPVAMYMSRELVTAKLDTSTEALARSMHGGQFSALPIVDDDGNLAGVVSRTDLIHLGALQTGRRWTSPAMPLPHRRADQIMRPAPETVSSAAPLREAATIMVRHQLHHVFVLDDDVLVGVISAVDLAAAVRDAKIDKELSTIMTAPIVTIDVHAPLSAAVDLIERLRLTGLVVTDDGLPVGTMAQTEILASRDLPRGTPIESVYDPAVICLPAQTKLYRAADHVTQIEVRRVVVCRAREAVGIVTALDFARFVAG